GGNSGGTIARLGTITNNAFEFITNNTFRFKINNTGEIGFGDSNPDGDFEVSANGVSSGNLMLLSSDDNTDGDIMTVLRSGNVGIGTTSPIHRLDVAGSVRIGTTAVIG